MTITISTKFVVGVAGLVCGVIAASSRERAVQPEPVAPVHLETAAAAMPAKMATDEEMKTFFEPGGIYSSADITANGTATPSVKFKGIRAMHDDNPKPGEKLCPISKTKANPKFTWVINGKGYEFCCVPCIEEFVDLAKTKPGEVQSPGAYVK